MALQVGMIISKNGVQYRLNENHRWTHVQGQGGAPMPGAAPRPSSGGRQGAPSLPKMKPKMPPMAMPGASPQRGMTPAQKAPQNAPASSSGAMMRSDVDSDPNKDGITDKARVGVPAFDVPPPPKKIPRLSGLSPVASKAQESFASDFERNPDNLTDDAIVLFTAHSEPGKPATFETDACKKLSAYWQSASLEQDLEQRSKNRATLNTALHQTANAICKRAFVKHLDTLSPGSEILVTVGGCGAGKGYALKNVPQALEMKDRAAVVWDSAGDQNATENPWILQEARKRGLKVNYVFVHADPKVQWADPGRGVVKRAQDPNDGRMVDAKVFADSYAIGAKNHYAFAQKHQHDPDVKCVYLLNGANPQLLNDMPSEALQVNRQELASFAIDYVKNNSAVPEHIRQGALGGTQIWED